MNIIKIIFFTSILLISSLVAKATTPDIPHLQTTNQLTRLIVDGKPWLMIAGELHNSTSSAPEYLAEAMRNTAAMNVNTVIASVAWEQFEAQEGKFDYTLIDNILTAAEKYDLKIVLIWFASWKNGESSYVPLWVKSDTKRFFRILNKSGEQMSAISAFCDEAKKADAKAFVELMKYIKLKDTRKSIIMIQPQNEVGAFSEMDYNKAALDLYASQVPEKLIQHLKKNRNILEEELKTAWETNGSKTKGNWAQLFGEHNYDAQNFFLTWHYASYIEDISRQGRAVYNLPMYANAWLVQYPGEQPGKYPNGGPVSRVIDIYKAAAPSIDFCAPDIYLPNFREVCSMYHRPAKNNPLFIPECERSNPGKAWYALAEHDALGFAPFGVESLVSDAAYSESLGVLKEMLPIIERYQGTGKMRGILKEGNEERTELEMGDYKIEIEYLLKDKNCYGMIIQTSDDEFLIAGVGLRLKFGSLKAGRAAFIGTVLEGGYADGEWKTRRWLNGDETWHNTFLFAHGRNFSVFWKEGKPVVTPFLAPIPVLNQSLESNLQTGQVQAPGIYKVKMYEINRPLNPLKGN
jgi:beta-galactosidase GanA